MFIAPAISHFIYLNGGPGDLQKLLCVKCWCCWVRETER